MTLCNEDEISMEKLGGATAQRPCEGFSGGRVTRETGEGGKGCERGQRIGSGGCTGGVVVRGVGWGVVNSGTVVTSQLC